MFSVSSNRCHESIDPNTVWHKNLEWQRGRNGGWCLIGCPADDKLGDEPFSIAEMVISLISKSGQDSNVDVVLNERES